MQWHIRPSTPKDIPFVFSSWVQSFREINILKVKSLPGDIESKEYKTGPALWDKEVYFKRQRALIEAVLAASSIAICCNPEDPEQIFGFIVYRDFSPRIRIVSYTYTKHIFRKEGVARSLYESLGDCHIATHGGVSTRKLISRAGLVFDPFFDYELEIRGRND